MKISKTHHITKAGKVKKNPISKPFRVGEKVILKDDGETYRIYAIYSPTEVSLGLLDYPDVEQDYTTPVSSLRRLK